MDDTTLTAVAEALADMSDSGLAPDAITAETRLRDDLQLDSLRAVDAVIVLEDRYGIELLPERLRGLQTVGQVVEVIDEARRQGAQDG